MPTAIAYDREPGFIADMLVINGRTVCVLSTEATTDASTRALVRTFMQSQGIDCMACRNCPVGAQEQSRGDGC